VPHSICLLAVGERKDKRVLAHDSDGSEFDGYGTLAIVGIGKEQVSLAAVVANDLHLTGNLGEYPNPFAVT
jgi:hypothetical protein